MNSINLGTITIPIVKGEKGDKPVKGVDYWTEQDQEQIINDVEQAYNVNHEAKIAEYNENASDQINEFNGFVTLKKEEFDENVTLKTTDFDSNASDKTTLFNTNATSKTDDFNDNATSKTTTFNENVTSKTTEFNELVEDKEDEIDGINNTLTPRVEALESGMSNYYKKTETYSKTEIDNKVSSVYRYKGTVSTYADLPSSDLTVGDVYNVETADSTHGIKAGDNVSWNGTVWDVLAGTVDLSGYQTKIDNSHKLASDLLDDTNQTNKFVTTSEKTTWNAKYDKPSGGIPSTDLSSAVQTSLGKADTAVQDVSGKEDNSNKVTSIDENSTNTQYPGAKLLYDQLAEKQEQIDGLVTENALLKDQIPNGTAEGTTVQITDSSNLLIEYGVIKGYTNQVQYEGYNLFDIGEVSDYSPTGSVTSTANSILTFLITGSGSTYTYNTKINFAGNTTYTITVKPSVAYSRCFVRLRNSDDTAWLTGNDATITGWSYNQYYRGWYKDNSSINVNFSITIPSCLYCQFGFGYSNNVAQAGETQTISEIQIEQGSTAHDYEPYTGGQPSPNPDYKQDIHTVTGDCEVEVVSKNLLSPPSSNETVTNIGMTFSCNKNNEYHLRGTSTSAGNVIINYSLENDYVIQENDYLHLFNDTIPTGTIQIVGVSPTGQIFASTITSVGKIMNLSAYAGKIIHYFFIFCLAGASANMTMTPMIINNISTATTYTPHAEQNAPLTLGNIELCKIGDYQDYLFKNVRTLRSGRANPLFNADLDEGDWYKYDTIKKYIFDGNENWIPVNNSENARNVGLFTTFKLQDIKYYPSNDSIIPAMCSDQYISKPNYYYGDYSRTRADFTISTIYGNIFYLQNGNFSDYTNEQVKNAMIGTILYYPLETPTYTKITDTTLIAQLEAYYNSSTYRNVTNIITAGEDLAPIASIVYKKDLTTLFNKLDSLEARVDLSEE